MTINDWFGAVVANRYHYLNVRFQYKTCRWLVAREGQELAELRRTVTNHMSMVSVWRMSVVVPNSDEGTDSVLMGTSAIARDIAAQVQLL